MTQEAQLHNLSIVKFKGVNTQAPRKSIADGEFAWLENVIPIGDGNLVSVPSISAVIATISPDTAGYTKSVNINDIETLFIFALSGALYSVMLVSPYTVIKIARAGTFSSSGMSAVSWQNSSILIIDPTYGYFTATATAFTPYRGAVTNALITAAGTNFTVSPTVVPTTGNAIFASSIGVTLATISALGSGYGVNDVLTVVGGTFTTATQLQVSSVNSTGAITGFNITVEGLYSIAPGSPVSVTGGHGTGATFTVNMGLSAITVVSPGSGYGGIAPLLTVGGSGGAIASTTITGYGANYSTNPAVTANSGAATFTSAIGVVQVVINTGSAGYIVGDILTVVGGTFTTPAQFTVSSVSGGTGAGTIVSGTITAYGGNYSTNPTVTANSGTATFSSAIGVVQAVVNVPGSGYVVGDILTMVGGTSTTAAQLQVSSTSGGGTIVSATVTSNGNGYSTNPTVTANSGTATFGSAIGVVSAGINAAGNGYAIGDTLTVNGGVYSTPAQFVVNVVGAGTSVAYGTITAYGGNYSTNPTVTANSGTATFSSAIGVVQAVVNAPGSGYVVGDILTMVGGTSTTAAQLQVAGISSNGAITVLNITDPGYYTSMPSSQALSVVGGNGTGATFNISRALTAIAVISGGSGYTTAPGLTVSGGGGTGATAIATLSSGGGGDITAITVVNSGQYSTAPTQPIIVIGGSGTGATFNINIGLTAVTIVSTGSGYSSAPGLSVNGGGGSGATAASTLSGGGGNITGLRVYNPGYYTSMPSSQALSVTGGSGAGASINISRALTAIAVISGGSGYTTAPGLTVSGGGGTGATAIATLSSVAAGLTGVTITDPGYYTSMPSSQALSVVGGNGTGATFNVSIGLTAVTIVSAGSGYTTAPGLTVSGGGGTGATAIATLSSSGGGVGATAVAVMANNMLGNCIESYGNRVWIANGRTLVFSAPNSSTDFNPTNAAGSFVMTDSSFRGPIVSMYTGNGYLYIIGETSVNIISNIQVTGTPPVTNFSNVNISDQVGSDMPQGVLIYYRGLIIASGAGVFSLMGVSPQKLSDGLDGFLRNVNFGQLVTCAQFTLLQIPCMAFLFNYLDPTQGGAARNILAIFFNGKWFFASPSPGLKFIGTTVINGIPTAWGSDGTNVYLLFQNTSSPVAHKIVTKLYDLQAPLLVKQVYKIAIECSSAASTALSGTLDSDYTTVAYNTLNVAPGYNFLPEATSSFGAHIGMTIVGTIQGVVYTGFHLQLMPRGEWGEVP